MAIDKALEKDPGERYQTMREMVVDLKRLARKTESAAPPASIASRPKSTTGWWIGAAAFVAAAVVVAALVLRSTEAPDNPLANALFTRFTDFPGSETDAAISRDGKWIAFRSDRDGPIDTFVSQIGSGRFTNLTHGTQVSSFVRNVGFTPDGSEVWLSGLVGGGRLRLIPLTGGNARAFLPEHAVNAAWSPDGSRIVFHTLDAGDPMFVADSTGAHVQQIFTLSAGGHNHFPTWSPDGQWIYFVSGLWDTREMDLWRIGPSGGPPERLTHLSTDIRSVAPLDDRTILYAAPDQNGDGPWLWALDTERKVSRRVSTGLEVYQSVEASADGRRLVAAVSNPTANLWSIPLMDRPTEDGDVKPFGVPTVRAWGPRYGGTSLFYLSSRGGGDGLWRYDSGQAIEIWKGADGPLFDPPAISFDGRHVAVILRKQGRHTLNTLSADGGDLRPIAETIDVSSAAGWSPDGKWIVAGGTDKEGPGLFKIPVESGAPVRLTKGVAYNPVWSPDGSLIVYTGPTVGVNGPLLMVHPDGSPREAPPILLRIGGARYRFVPGRQELVYVSAGSQFSLDDLWLLNLSTMKTRRLSTFDNRVTRTFDITPDGKQIVFDRLRDNADVVLIDLPK
jgi:Tol biopolymer transport system component